VVADVARIQARRLHDRLPSQVRDKLPEITQEFLKER
jgi:cation transport regulator ChaB